MISTSHEAKSIFSVSPNRGYVWCFLAHLRPQVWHGNGEICCGLWRNIRTGLCLPSAGVLSPCFGCCGNIPAPRHSSGLQLLPAQPPHTILIRVSGVLHGCIPEQSSSVHATLQMGFGTVGDFYAQK